MDAIEKVEPEIESALQAHFASEYGSPRPAGVVWQAIAEQLGEQEGKAPAQVARNLNGTYKGHGQQAGSMHEVLRTPQAASRKSQRLWTPAIAATLVLAMASVLVGLLAVTNSSKGEPIPVPNLLPNPGFESGLGKWAQGEGTVDYATGIDTSVAHSGNASAYISSTVADSAKFGTLGTAIPAQGLQGKRVMFSAYVKTKGERAWAELYMGITGDLPPELHDQQHILGTAGTSVSVLDADNMDDRPILGTTDWTRYNLVLDVPTDSTKIDLEFMFGGPGRGWFDDVQLSVVANGVPTTSAYRNSQPVNMGFEEGLTGWERGMMSNPHDYTIGTDTSTYYDGKASGLVQSSPSAGQGAHTFDLHQIVNTENYKGKRVRFSAFLKTQNVQDNAQIWIGIQDISDLTVSMEWSAQAHGTADWQKYQAEADVPANYSLHIYLAVILNGSGKVWVDDAQLQIVGEAAPASPTPTSKP